MPAELKARITLDDKPLQAGLARAQGHVKGFTGKIDQIFARVGGPEKRAEKFTTALTSSLSGVGSGGGVRSLINSAGGILTGLGASAGIGIAAVAIGETFAKIREQEQATKEKSKELRKELQAISRDVTFESTAEGLSTLESRLESERKTARHLRDELSQFDGSKHPFANFGRTIGSLVGLAQSPGDRSKETSDRIVKSAENLAETRKTILQTLHEELGLTAQLIDGSEAAAKFDATRLKYVKERKDLEKIGLKGPELRDLDLKFQLEKRLFQQEQQAALLQSGLKQSALYGANVGSGKTGSQASIEDLRRRRADIQRQQLLPHTIEQGRKFEEDKLDLDNQIDAARLEASRMTPGQRRDAQRKAQRDQFDLNQLNRNKGLINVRRDMSGNVIGGTDPFTGESRTVGTESGGSHLGGGHMAKPGHMTPFGGSDDFNSFFNKRPDQQDDGKRSNGDKPLTEAGMRTIVKEYWEPK